MTRMTKEEALKIWLPVIKMGVESMQECSEALDMAIEALKQEPCEDAVSRQAVEDAIAETSVNGESLGYAVASDILSDLPSVTPKMRTGEWQRMSDLPEDEDNRYQCSRCDNVVHFSSKENLYTFSRWCGRCGSNNDRE